MGPSSTGASGFQVITSHQKNDSRVNTAGSERRGQDLDISRTACDHESKSQQLTDKQLGFFFFFLSFTTCSDDLSTHTS